MRRLAIDLGVIVGAAAVGRSPCEMQLRVVCCGRPEATRDR